MKEKGRKLHIPRGNPIRFRESNKKHNFLRVDLFGKLEQVDLANTELKAGLTIRIWSLKEEHYHRNGVDCIQTKLKINRERGRVLTRFHFDSAEHDAWEPRYHFQIGGKYRDDDEHCWYPPWLDVPRFAYHPMDLILACEFVVANFFPEVFPQIVSEPTWQHALVRAQEEYVFPYLEFVARCKSRRQSLLQHLCSSHERT
jgi:hypothetical protein